MAKKARRRDISYFEIYVSNGQQVWEGQIVWNTCTSFQQHLKVESEIWDLEAKSGLFWDHFGTLVPFGTKSRIRDLIGPPVFS